MVPLASLNGNRLPAAVMSTANEKPLFPRRSVKRGPPGLLAGVDWALVLLTATLLFCLIVNRPTGTLGLSRVMDDFYYYSQVAANIVAGHGSTFNGVVPTNGYHPLWMVVIVLLTAVTHTLNGLIWAVEAVMTVAAIASFYFSRRILLEFIKRRPLADILAILSALLALSFLRSGMEVILTVPLALALISCVLRTALPWTSRQAAGLAFLASLTILSRLDAVLLIGLLSALLFLQAEFRATFRFPQLAGALLGFLPLFLYLGSNVLWFHGLMPISGQAKQLRSTYIPSAAPFYSFAQMLATKERVCIGIVVLAALWSIVVIGRLSPVQRAVVASVLAFPVLHWCVLSVLSDWPLWIWYYYTVAVAFPVALSILLSDVTTPLPAVSKAAWLVELLIGFVCLANAGHMVYANAVKKQSSENLATEIPAATFIRNFAASHPGRYAMGDRAGLVAAMLPYPLIQTEGLVMDKPFLERIRRQENLLDVLRAYDVRYYIGTLYGTKPLEGCFHAVEPAKAGPTSAHMRADLCMAPVAEYQVGEFRTLIFDLGPARAGSGTTARGGRLAAQDAR